MPGSEEFLSEEYSMKEFSSFQVDNMPIEKRFKRGVYFIISLALGSLICYLAVTKHKKLWQVSVDFIENKDSHPKWIDTSIDWLMKPFYHSLNFIVAITFMMIPKKNVAMKIICLHSLVYLIVKYSMTIIKGNRLVFDDTINFTNMENKKCTCSFGFPSSQSAEATFIFCIYFYELLINCKRKYTEAKKYLFKFLCILLIVLVHVSKFYLTLHTIPQIAAGSAIGFTVFFGSLVIEDKLNRFFSCCFFGRYKQMTVLLGLAFSITIMNLVLWLFFLEDTVKKFRGFQSERCFNCFRLDLLEIRQNTTAAFQYYLLFIGVVLGVFFLRPAPRESTAEGMVDHFSCRGLARLVLMLVLHLPILILHKPLSTESTIGQVLVLFSLVYLGVGIGISYGFTIISRKIGLALPGDVQSQESPGNTFYKQEFDQADMSWNDDK